jgi:hypothetical protein
MLGIAPLNSTLLGINSTYLLSPYKNMLTHVLQPSF